MSSTAEGFVINEVELKGFMRYRDPARVPFHGKFSVITGPTGSGKTSLLDAVTFNLYGKSSRTDVKAKIDEFVDRNGYVILRFSRGGHNYEVIRGRKNGRSYLTLSRGDQRIAGSTTDLEHRVENLVGLDYIGFRNSTFIRQDEMKQIGSETGAERLAIFERLFRLEVFERAQDLSEKKLKAVEGKLSDAKAELGQKQKEFTETLPEERKKLEKAAGTHTSLTRELEGLKKKVNDADQVVKKLEPAHHKYEEAALGINDTGTEIQRLKAEFDKAVKRNKDRQELRNTFQKLRDYPKEEKRLDRQRETLEGKGREHEHLAQRKRDREKAIERIKKNTAKEISEVAGGIRREQGRLTNLARTMSKDEAFNILREEGALTERVARITKEIGWLKDLLPASFIETLTNEQKDAQKKVVRVAAKTKKITGDIFVKTEIETSIKRMNDQLERLRDRAKEQVVEEQVAIEKLEGQVKRVGFSPAALARLRDIRKRLDEISGSVKQYEITREKLEKLPDQGPLLTNLKTRIQQLGKKLNSFTAQEKRLAPEEERYSEAVKQQESLGETLGNIREELGKAEGERNVVEKRVRELEGLAPAIQKMEEGLKGLEAEREVFTVLKQDVFHRKGLLLFAINQLLQGISIEASKILGDLTDERLNKIRLTPTSEVRGGTVRIEVEGVDGLFRDVSAFSGGEKTQVNAALRFAISKELARMPQIGKSYGNMKTLFIDEGDLGSLDTENARVFFVRKLLSMGDLFERVVLITHITEVADQFPSRIRVYMTPERFSRVEVGVVPA